MTDHFNTDVRLYFYWWEITSMLVPVQKSLESQNSSLLLLHSVPAARNWKVNEISQN